MPKTIKVSDEVYGKIMDLQGKSANEKLKLLLGCQKVTSDLTEAKIQEMIDSAIAEAKKGY